MKQLYSVKVDESAILHCCTTYHVWKTEFRSIVTRLPEFVSNYLDNGTLRSSDDDQKPLDLIIEDQKQLDVIIEEILIKTVSPIILDPILRSESSPGGRALAITFDEQFRNFNFQDACYMTVDLTQLLFKMSVLEQIKELNQADPRLWNDFTKVWIFDLVNYGNSGVNEVYQALSAIQDVNGNNILPSWQTVCTEIQAGILEKGEAYFSSNKNFNVRGKKSSLTCFKCQGFGHVVSECPSKQWFDLAGNVKTRKNNKRANAALASSGTAHAWISRLVFLDDSTISSSSKPASNTSSSNGILLDSGATHHLNPCRFT